MYKTEFGFRMKILQVFEDWLAILHTLNLHPSGCTSGVTEPIPRCASACSFLSSMGLQGTKVILQVHLFLWHILWYNHVQQVTGSWPLYSHHGFYPWSGLMLFFLQFPFLGTNVIAVSNSCVKFTWQSFAGALWTILFLNFCCPLIGYFSYILN